MTVFYGMGNACVAKEMLFLPSGLLPGFFRVFAGCGHGNFALEISFGADITLFEPNSQILKPKLFAEHIKVKGVFVYKIIGAAQCEG